MRAVQVAAADQGHLMLAEQVEEPCARLWLHGPVARVAFIGIREKERAVQEPREPAAARFSEGRLEPFELISFLSDVAPEEQGVEADQAPLGAIVNPAIRAEMSPPSCQARVVDRLMRVKGVADVMVAGNSEDRPPD